VADGINPVLLNGEQMENPKKIAAAISAVMKYIQSEEEAVCMARAMPATAAGQAAPAIALKPWGMSGRQNQMQLRNMMQMKAFHKRN
jgi:hypothetical protein